MDMLRLLPLLLVTLAVAGGRYSMILLCVGSSMFHWKREDNQRSP